VKGDVRLKPDSELNRYATRGFRPGLSKCRPFGAGHQLQSYCDRQLLTTSRSSRSPADQGSRRRRARHRSLPVT
jgi:hypothetical protein